MRDGNETVETVEGHRSQIRLDVWRPIGWTQADEASAQDRYERECRQRDAQPARDTRDTRETEARIAALLERYPLRQLGGKS